MADFVGKPEARSSRVRSRPGPLCGIGNMPPKRGAHADTDAADQKSGTPATSAGGIRD
jgi:hypothetical protein